MNSLCHAKLITSIALLFRKKKKTSESMQVYLHGLMYVQVLLGKLSLFPGNICLHFFLCIII